MADQFDPTSPVSPSEILKNITVKRTEGSEGVHYPHGAGQERKKRHRHDQEKNENKDNFERLAKETEIYNNKLISQKSPFRFCIYRKEEGVFIDFVILDEKGQIKKLIQKDITHQDFKKWIRHIDEGEGLMYDGTV
jgi:hypothetical protein